MTSNQRQFISGRYKRKQYLRYAKHGISNIACNRHLTVVSGIYALAVIIVWLRSSTIFGLDQAYVGAMLRSLFNLTYPIFVTVLTLMLTIRAGMPKGSAVITDNLLSIGFTNRAGEPPLLVGVLRDAAITVYAFETRGLPLEDWISSKAVLSSALNVHVVKIKQGRDNRRILLYTVPATQQLPDAGHWRDDFLAQSISVFVLGESLLGQETVDLSKIPHILIGGTTGSGKTVLIRNLLYQAISKGARVIIADFKGVDFGRAWQQHCEIILNEESLIDTLNDVIKEMYNRRDTLQGADLPNIFEYNQKFGKRYNHILIAVDEIGELLDKTGASKERKETIAEIESCLSTIARQGRAFGVNLILGTQRPDANILSGQIKNNVDCRICGRADNVLSQIILDNTDAATLIPKDARGRFLRNDGTVFQGYWFDESKLDSF